MSSKVCLHCEHSYNADEKRKRFQCHRFPHHEIIDDFPQNYKCGEWCERVVKKSTVPKAEVTTTATK